MTITCAMWNYRNNISLEITHNPVSIIEHAMKNQTTLYNKQTNTLLQGNNTGTTQCNRIGRSTKHQWTPPPPNWEKWNRVALRIDSKKFTIISYIYIDNSGKILQISGTTIEYCSVLVTETLTIREVIRSAIRMTRATIIMKSDSQVTNLSAIGKIIARKQILI